MSDTNRILFGPRGKDKYKYLSLEHKFPLKFNEDAVHFSIEHYIYCCQFIDSDNNIYHILSSLTNIDQVKKVYHDNISKIRPDLNQKICTFRDIFPDFRIKMYFTNLDLLIYQFIIYKYHNCSEFRNILVQKYESNFYYLSDEDYWGINVSGKGKNKYGFLLQMISRTFMIGNLSDLKNMYTAFTTPISESESISEDNFKLIKTFESYLIKINEKEKKGMFDDSVTSSEESFDVRSESRVLSPSYPEDKSLSQDISEYLPGKISRSESRILSSTYTEDKSLSQGKISKSESRVLSPSYPENKSLSQGKILKSENKVLSPSYPEDKSLSQDISEYLPGKISRSESRILSPSYSEDKSLSQGKISRSESRVFSPTYTEKLIQSDISPKFSRKKTTKSSDVRPPSIRERSTSQPDISPILSHKREIIKSTEVSPIIGRKQSIKSSILSPKHEIIKSPEISPDKSNSTIDDKEYFIIQDELDEEDEHSEENDDTSDIDHKDYIFNYDEVETKKHSIDTLVSLSLENIYPKSTINSPSSSSKPTSPKSTINSSSSSSKPTSPKSTINSSSSSSKPTSPKSTITSSSSSPKSTSPKFVSSQQTSLDSSLQTSFPLSPIKRKQPSYSPRKEKYSPKNSTSPITFGTYQEKQKIDQKQDNGNFNVSSKISLSPISPIIKSESVPSYHNYSIQNMYDNMPASYPQEISYAFADVCRCIDCSQGIKHTDKPVKKQRKDKKIKKKEKKEKKKDKKTKKTILLSNSNKTPEVTLPSKIQNINSSTDHSKKSDIVNINMRLDNIQRLLHETTRKITIGGLN